MERKGKGAVQWLQCGGAVLLGWCWCAAAELNFAFLLFPSSLGLASCNSVSRSLLPAPSAEGSICLTEKCYCVLVDFILRVTTTRFQQAFTVTDEGQSCVDWAASAVCSYKVVISACLIARLLRRLCCRLCFLHSNLARYLVDPASSHMLVSKIKPCMSKYKPE